VFFTHFIGRGIGEAVVAFMAALVVSVCATFAVRRIARKLRIVDMPSVERKRHERPVALLGGLGLFVSFWLVIGAFLWLHPDLVLGKVTLVQLASVFLATCGIIALGIADEIRDLRPRTRFIATLFIAFAPLLGGIGLDGITNPFGGTIGLDRPQIYIPVVNTLLMIGDAVIFFWLLGMMYTTKLLDGLDGLATGIAAIGGIMIFLLTRTPKFFQPDVGLLAAVFVGVCLGFLFFNFKPASIFLGESGSLLLGFILGILAVISGGKIATALLVMAVPILDVARVMIVRLLRKQKLSQGDREHLHYRLLDLGFSERSAVLLLYGVAFLFGASTLFLPSTGKIIVLGFLLVFMVALSVYLHRRTTAVRAP
jgi:UDP-GlcNAc:undecaprenyl-phosphate GlcNAc-1-phosphate transferase